MVKTAANPILLMLRSAVGPEFPKNIPDQDLLQRFVAQQDPLAFSAILKRHGPMVWSVCRTVVPSEADAEDAFQATFLIFAKKPGSIRKSHSLASWLHGVAYRTALKAKADFAKRRKHEKQSGVGAIAARDELNWREIQQVMHEELNRLAEHHRAPLMLCYLQGKTQEEAAAILAVTKDALRGRLERGRTLLRERLARRGLGTAALLLAAAWPAASTAAPLALVASTVQAGALLATGQAATNLISPKALRLAQGVMKMMFLRQLKTAAVLGLVIAVFMLGGGTLVWQSQAGGLLPPHAQKGEEPGNVLARANRAAGALNQAQPNQAPLEDPKVVEAIEAAGGKVYFFKEQEHRWTKVEFWQGKGDDASLRHLKGLRHLETLNIVGKQFTEAGLSHLKDVKTIRTINWSFDVSDAGLAHLKGWTKLQVMQIWDTPITGTGLEHLKGFPLKDIIIMSASAPGFKQFSDAGMAHLKGFPKLETLCVIGNDLTDAGLVHLKGMVHLERLTLGSDRITDKGLVHLKALSTGKLQQLALHCEGVTNAGLEHLKDMTNLTSLSLSSTAVNDDGLRKLQGLTKLTGLTLSGTGVTDAGLAHLKALSGNLSFVDLQRTNITDAGLAHLQGFKKLEHLNLSHTAVTNAGIEELQKTLPNVKIER